MLNKLSTLIAFILMVIINALANILPINNITSGEVSDLYQNLFAPAGITFSIWGVIYFLLFVYVIYQFFPKSLENEKIIKKINIYFIISSFFNATWIFLWHYQLIGLSVIIILLMAYCLFNISKIINKNKLNLKNKLFLKIPFGVYFAWITIATLANIITFFVSIGWNNFIFSEQIWTIIFLLFGLVITCIKTNRDQNIAYGLVPIWAYYGIYLKHTSLNGFNKMYPSIIAVVIFCILFLIIANLKLLIKKRVI